MNHAGRGYEWRHNEEHHAAQARMAHLDAYYAWTMSLFGDRFEAPAVDAGAGSGHFSALLAGAASPLLLLEGGQENLAALRARFAMHDDVHVQDIDLNDCAAAISAFGTKSIFTLDVLEHLPDDVRVLSQFHDSLPVGGRIYVKVPALPWLFGPTDEASGHFRRYTRKSLRLAMETAGFRVQRCHYMNFAGVAPYFLKSRILRKSQNFSRTFTPAQIRRIASIMPFLRTLNRWIGPPIGLSLICIAEKAANHASGAEHA